MVSWAVLFCSVLFDYQFMQENLLISAAHIEYKKAWFCHIVFYDVVHYKHSQTLTQHSKSLGHFCSQWNTL